MSRTSSSSAVIHEALVYSEGNRLANAEPWDDTTRAGEVLRHDDTPSLAAQLRPSYQRILDVGRSLGRLTVRLYVLVAAPASR
jgi:hypothetical protein